MNQPTEQPLVVLAFSGGLDTSYCVKYLAKEQGYRVHSVTVNTGGFSPEEIEELEQHARDLGVEAHTTIDLTERYYQECIRYMIFGNMLKNHAYPLSVSSERTFQAKAVVDHAKKIGADHLAHGSTGAGNDQIRFDLIARTEAPEMGIITPIRDQGLSREKEIEYLQNEGVAIDTEKSRYSVNQGLWGTTVGGKETLTSDQPLPEEAYPSQPTEEAPSKLTIGFQNGEPVSVNGTAYDPVTAIRKIEALGKAYAIGRGIHVGDTIIGIKGRVGFEAPAPILIIEAHRQLEKHTLSKWQLLWKDQLAAQYTQLLHEGQHPEPAMRDVESFLESTQRTVTGEVHLELHPKRFEILGIASPYDLMQKDSADYGEMNENWTGEDVKGFTRIMATALKGVDEPSKAGTT